MMIRCLQTYPYLLVKFQRKYLVNSWECIVIYETLVVNDRSDF